MVGRASKKQRTGVESHRSPRDEPTTEAVPGNRVSPGPLLFDPSPAEPSFITIHEPMHPLTHLPLSDTVEVNRLSLQNALGDYDDIPLVPEAGDEFWIEAANLVQGANPDGPNSDGVGDIASNPHQAPNTAPDEYMRVLPGDTSASSFRSQVLERTAAHVPREYHDKSVVAQYPHAATLISVIEYLEGHLQIAKIPIDRAMRSNRDAMAKVRATIDSDEFRRCQSCPSLVATIMDLVVSLYEVVILSMQSPIGEDGMISWPELTRPPGETENPLRPSSRGSSGGSGGIARPLFQFGCLEFDPDEQDIFRNAMMRRDLGRCVETIQHCSQGARERQNRAADLNGAHHNSGRMRLTRSGADRAQLQWYLEMEHQATMLLETLPAKCRHGGEPS